MPTWVSEDNSRGIGTLGNVADTGQCENDFWCDVISQSSAAASLAEKCTVCLDRKSTEVLKNNSQRVYFLGVRVLPGV